MWKLRVLQKGTQAHSHNRHEELYKISILLQFCSYTYPYIIFSFISGGWVERLPPQFARMYNKWEKRKTYSKLPFGCLVHLILRTRWFIYSKSPISLWYSDSYRYGCLKFIFIAKAVTCVLYTYVNYWKRDGRSKGGGEWYITELMDLLGCFAICASMSVLCSQCWLKLTQKRENCSKNDYAILTSHPSSILMSNVMANGAAIICI